MAFTLSGDAATNRTNLGLGTAATLNVGTSANNIVQLDGSGNLPAIDGSALTGVDAGKVLKVTYGECQDQNIGKPHTTWTAYNRGISNQWFNVTKVSATSKIFVTGYLTVSGGSNFHPSFAMYREETDGSGASYIYGNGNTSASPVALYGSNRMGINSYTGESADQAQKAIPLSVVDTYASAANLRYAIYVRDLNNGDQGSNSLYINRNASGVQDYYSITTFAFFEVEV